MVHRRPRPAFYYFNFFFFYRCIKRCYIWMESFLTFKTFCQTSFMFMNLANDFIYY